MYHKIVIVGNLGRDPELSHINGDRSVVHFSLATNRNYKGSDGNQVKETIWFRITVWGKLAEICNQFLHKGSKVLVEGRLQPDDTGNPKIWNRSDGSAASSFEVVALDVRFLDSKNDSNSNNQNNQNSLDVSESEHQKPYNYDDDDDIPF